MTPSNFYDNIPAELKALNQWVAVSLEANPNPDGKPLKVPYIPGTDFHASSTNPTNWRTFDEAVVAGREHVGLVFTESDPYVFIDLDDPEDPEQQAVFKRLDTYAQRSVSGSGVHIIAKGRFEGTGRHPSSPDAGIFQTQRYALMTGDVIDGRSEIKDVLTEDLQSVHSWLSTGDKHTTDLVEHDSKIPNMTVVEMGIEKWHRFEGFCKGEWEHIPEYAGNHSEADHAFIAMLTELTPSNEQVRYLFSASGMWNDERKQKKGDLTRYVDRTIKQIRGKQEKMQKVLEMEPEPIEAVVNLRKCGSCHKIDSMPDGLLKSMAKWIWQQSRYPLQESAISAAFSIMSTVGGRNYQTYSKLGLNVWFILIAGTGTGKNEYQNGISKIIKQVSDANKFGNNFFNLFGGSMASGQAVEDNMADRNRCFTYFPEFAGTYQNLTQPNTAPHHASLRDTLLNIYMQSSENAYLPRRMKAKTKGEPQDLQAIQAPCLVLGGESTEEAMYANVSSKDLLTGFLQRFSILHAEDESISRYSNPDMNTPMPEELVNELLEFFVHCDQLAASGEFINVPTSKQAKKLLNDYDHDRRGQSLDRAADGATRELYNRSAVKAIRIATQLGVAENWRSPLVKSKHAQWAMDFVDACDAQLLSRFKSGSIGSGQVKQENDILKTFANLARTPTKDRKKLGMPQKMAEKPLMVTYSILKREATKATSFAEDRNGAVSAFNKSLESLIKAGIIVRLPEEAWKKFGHEHGELLFLVR